MPKGFPREKVLPVTFSEYCASVGRELKDYELVGVHGNTVSDHWQYFFDNVPEGTEVVVNYCEKENHIQSTKPTPAYGLALIPRNRKPKEEK